MDREAGFFRSVARSATAQVDTSTLTEVSTMSCPVPTEAPTTPTPPPERDIYVNLTDFTKVVSWLVRWAKSNPDAGMVLAGAITEAARVGEMENNIPF
jgi:hypothetical protein